MPIGPKVGVIGAGDTAMDCIRSARRVGAGEVNLIYRRTVDQMPADPEEIQASIEEGIKIIELATPAGLRVDDGKLAAITCTRTEYRGERDASGRNIPFAVPDSEFDIELDTLILAISQHSVLDFFGDNPPELTERGYIKVDPDTYESSIPGLYAGGDVAADGPASIVKAAADGKAVASAIIAGHSSGERSVVDDDFRSIDLQGLMVRRARREYRVPIRFTPVDQRNGFEETVINFSAEEAIAEASRCLDCHDICSLCVGVCPNMALMTYEMNPVTAKLPTLRMSDAKLVAAEAVEFRISQGLQIAVLTDFCNECGNCTTVCPTSGEPYRDKPRLYLDRADFESQTDNAFMLHGQSAVECRVDGETYRVDVNDRLEYSSPMFTATLDRDTMEVIEASPSGGVTEGDEFSLEPLAVMLSIVEGVLGSMPHIPVPSDAGTFVNHPGYTEN